MKNKESAFLYLTKAQNVGFFLNLTEKGVIFILFRRRGNHIQYLKCKMPYNLREIIFSLDLGGKDCLLSFVLTIKKILIIQ